jgi:taurine--2-oxoglutarate transaminase
MHEQQKKELYLQSILSPWTKQEEHEPLMIKEAKGVYLTLEDGRTLLDMKSQAFCANLGHGHQGMIDAIVDAAKKSRVLSSDTFCEERLELALKLKTISNRPKDKVFFTLSGAEANENAIKIARMHTKRHKIITRYRSYHGATLATINFSGDYRRIPVDNAMTGVVRFPDHYPRGSGQTFDSVRLLEEIIEIEGPETIAAILLEGITGANGVFVPPSDYWPRIRKLCDQNGILLIADEVLSGFHRTGRWFGIDHFDVTPDIITMSKGLTAGYAPLGALLIDKKVADSFQNQTLWCGLTQYGHAQSCATASAAIGFYESDKIADNVKARGEELKAYLNNLLNLDIVAEVRAIGLLAAIDLKNKHGEPLVPYRAQGEKLLPTKLLNQELKKAGISTLVRFGTILISPPLVITESELKDGMIGVEKALKEVSAKLN